MDVNKVADKIMKCLRLSGSSNAHEAAAALRQAQKMMAEHGISEDDLKLLGYKDEAVDVPIQKNKKTPLVLTTLCALIKKAFGVKLVIEDRIGISDTSYRIRYFGPGTRVPLAAYAHQVVYRAMDAAWRTHLKLNPHLRGQRGVRTSFQVGWLYAVAEKVEAIGFPEDEVASTELRMSKHYGYELATSVTNKQKLYGSVMGKGAKAAADFDLNRPMDGSTQKRLS